MLLLCSFSFFLFLKFVFGLFIIVGSTYVSVIWHFQFFIFCILQSIQSLFQYIPDGIITVTLVPQSAATSFRQSFVADFPCEFQNAHAHFICLFGIRCFFEYLLDVVPYITMDFISLTEKTLWSKLEHKTV